MEHKQVDQLVDQVLVKPTSYDLRAQCQWPICATRPTCAAWATASGSGLAWPVADSLSFIICHVYTKMITHHGAHDRVQMQTHSLIQTQLTRTALHSSTES